MSESELLVVNAVLVVGIIWALWSVRHVKKATARQRQMNEAAGETFDREFTEPPGK